MYPSIGPWVPPCGHLVTSSNAAVAARAAWVDPFPARSAAATTRMRCACSAEPATRGTFFCDAPLDRVCNSRVSSCAHHHCQSTQHLYPSPYRRSTSPCLFPVFDLKCDVLCLHQHVRRDDIDWHPSAQLSNGGCQRRRDGDDHERGGCT